MATPTDNFKRNKAYFHAFSSVQTELSQNLFESGLKSGHNIFPENVLIEQVSYCSSVAEADAFVLANPTIVVKYTNVPLTMIPGSNGQAWYVDIAGEFIYPWIAPTDIPDPVTKTPSFGFQLLMYDSGGGVITPSQGVWNIDYNASVIIFDLGNTPADNGWGTPSVTFYQYIGKTLADTTLSNGAVVGKTRLFTQADLVGGRLTFAHNLGAKDEITTVTIKDNNNKEIEPDDVLHIDYNTVNVDFRMIEPIAGTWTILVTCLEDSAVPPIVLPPRYLNSHAMNSLTMN